MTLWKVQATFDNASFSFPLASNVNGAPEYAFGSYAMAALDNDGTLYTVNMIVQNSLSRTAGPYAGAVYESKVGFSSYRPVTNNDPYQHTDLRLGVLNEVVSALDGGAGFVGGGTLSISKDTATGQLIFSSPIGTFITTSAGSFATELRPAAVGIAFGLAWLLQPPTVPSHQVSVGIKGMMGLKDGTRISGSAGTAADPGSWGAWTQNAFIGVNWANPVFNQGLTEETASDGWPAVVGTTPATTEDAWYRPFTGLDASPTGFGLDIAAYFDHSALVGAWTQPPGMTALKVRRSHDDGHTWTEYTVFSGTDAIGSVSVQVFGGGIYVLYYDGTTTQTLRTVSFDAGNTWSTPVPVSISGTNPRLVISPEGSFFYFSLTSGNIVLQRSFDFGATLFDASPIIVDTGVPMQDFGAVIAADRSVVVAYASAGNAWVTRLSRDWGLTWSTA